MFVGINFFYLKIIFGKVFVGEVRFGGYVDIMYFGFFIMVDWNRDEYII